MTSPFNQFGFTADELAAFSTGDCGYLALALHEETGWDVVTISPVEAAETDFWYHAGAVMPDGRILDIKGAWSEDEFYDLWDSETYEVGIFPRDIEWASRSVRLRAVKYPDFDAAVYAREILDRIELLASV